MKSSLLAAHAISAVLLACVFTLTACGQPEELAPTVSDAEITEPEVDDSPVFTLVVADAATNRAACTEMAVEMVRSTLSGQSVDVKLRELGDSLEVHAWRAGIWGLESGTNAYAIGMDAYLATALPAIEDVCAEAGEHLVHVPRSGCGLEIWEYGRLWASDRAKATVEISLAVGNQSSTYQLFRNLVDHPDMSGMGGQLGVRDYEASNAALLAEEICSEHALSTTGTTTNPGNDIYQPMPATIDSCSGILDYWEPVLRAGPEATDQLINAQFSGSAFGVVSYVLSSAAAEPALLDSEHGRDQLCAPLDQ